MPLEAVEGCIKMAINNEDAYNPDTPLTHDNFYTDKAKDKAYMNEQGKKAETASKSLKELSGENFWNIGFFEHKSRHDTLDPKGNLKNYTPSMFVLNTSTADKISNPRRYFYQKGVENISMFSRTTESDTSRFLSNDTDTTNHAIALDNYDFFLRHNEEIQANLARTMLAKLDLDQDHKKTIDDLLNSQEWKKASGDEVFRELKNRLRQRGQELNDRYVPIFKLLHQSKELQGQYLDFLKKRLKVQEDIYKNRIESKDPLNLESLDETQKKRLRELFTSLSPILVSEEAKSKTLKEIIEQMIEEGRKEKAKSDEIAYMKQAIELNNLLHAGNQDMLTQNAYETMKSIEDFKELKEKYIQNHADSMSRSTRLAEQIALQSKLYPTAILSALTDKIHFSKHGDEKELAEIERTLQKEIAKMLPSDIKDPKAFTEAFLQRLRKNKDIFEHIYNPEKDDFNPQRRYIPLESVNTHDTAGNVIRDSLYLTLMEFKDKEDFMKLYDIEKERELLFVSTDREINKVKPSLDEVNDTFNAINLIEKSATGQMSQKESEIMLSSPLFQESSVLNKEDIEGLKDFSNSLAETSKTLRSKELVGTPSEQELRDSISEMHYLHYSKRLLSKMYPDKNDTNPLSRASKFIGRNFFQNNKALYDMQECMKSALNPTTSVETIPSMSRACMDKLKQAFEKEQEDVLANSSAKGWIAVTFVGFIHQMTPILARARADMLEKMIDEMNNKINNDALYVNNARDDFERMSRMLNIENANGHLGNHIASSSHVGDLADGIEKEHLVLSVMSHDIDKRGDLVFEKTYDLSQMPTGNMLNIQKISALKDEMNDIAYEQERLKERIMSNATLSGDANVEEMYIEIDRVALEIHIIEQKLEASRLLKEEEIMQLKDELTEKRAETEEKKERLYFYMKGLESNKEISQEIDINENLFEGKQKELEEILKNSSEDNKPLARNNRLRGRTEVNFEEAKGATLILALESIGNIKNQIDKKIMDEVKNNGKKSEVEKLKRDREKAVAINKQLTRKMLTDKELLSVSISQNLRRKHNINVPPNELEKHLSEKGLSAEGMALIFQEAQSLSSNDRLAIRSTIFEANTAIKELSKEGEIDGKHTNAVSSLIELMRSSDLFDSLKNNNDIYIAIDSIGDGKSYLRSAEGDLGYYIAHMDEIAGNIETAQSEEEKAEYRKLLAEGVEIGETHYQSSGIDFNEYKEIATKQAHSANTLEKANSAMHKRGMELRRGL